MYQTRVVAPQLIPMTTHAGSWRKKNSYYCYATGRYRTHKLTGKVTGRHLSLRHRQTHRPLAAAASGDGHTKPATKYAYTHVAATRTRSYLSFVCKCRGQYRTSKQRRTYDSRAKI